MTCNTPSSKGYSWCFITYSVLTGKKQQTLFKKNSTFFQPSLYTNFLKNWFLFLRHTKKEKRDRSQFVTKPIETKVIFSQDAQPITYVLNIKTWRNYKKPSLSYLISKNYLTDKNLYVCSFCLNHAKKFQKETLLETGTEDSILEGPGLEQERWYHWSLYCYPTIACLFLIGL